METFIPNFRALAVDAAGSDRIGKTVNVQVVRGGVLVELAIAVGE
jgi:hypothetical protein